jgi:D-alanine-D-alanine ligase
VTSASPWSGCEFSPRSASELAGIRLAVLGGGLPHRHLAWPIIRKVVEALQRRGYDPEVVDLERTSLSSWIDRVELAWIAQFGLSGDRGSLQGMLAEAGILYTGSGSEACAIAKDKLVTKQLLANEGVLTPAYREVDFSSDLYPQAVAMADELGLPVIVKPVLEGGSYGLSLATTVAEVVEAFEAAQGFGRAFGERFIRGRTLTSGVLGSGPREVCLPSHEVEFVDGRAFLDAQELFKPGLSRSIAPPRVSAETAEAVTNTAWLAHKAVHAWGVSRSDFRVADDQNVYFLELNTVPGLGELSDVPFAAARAGLGFDEVVERILFSAFDRPAHLR